ncbi:MAG: SPOR domain-containing protein [Acidiferrobacterales bacterium]|nr:SPOR domain-containing protein [Acidiferrobacterales bacterium]
MSRKRNKKTNRRKSSGFGLFILGILVGVISTVLTMGAMEDRPLNIGAGIASLLDRVEESDSVTESQGTKEESTADAQSKLQFGYHQFLLEDEYVLPQVVAPELKQQTAEVSQPEDTESENTQPEQTVQLPPEPEGSEYVLQVGSFNNFEDADAVKAKLALSGQQAFIQKVTVEDRGDFYRVRLGPFDQLNVLHEAAEFLDSIGFPSIKFRIKN